MSRHPFVYLVWLLAFGCSANLPDGRFRCAADSDCPSPLQCRTSDHLCYRDAVVGDAGPSPDTSPDGGACVDCVMVTITNAYGPGVEGQSLTLEAVTTSLPAYGDTSAPIAVSPGDENLDIESVMSLRRSLPTLGIRRLALVVGQDPDPLVVVPVFRLLPQDLQEPTAGRFNAALIDMLQTVDEVAMSNPAAPLVPVTMTPASDGGYVACDTGMRQALRLTRPPPGGAGDAAPLAVFDATDLPQTGAYYVVLVGRTDRHLAAPTGLRAIPVVPGAHAVLSRPVVWVLNATDAQVFVCDGNTEIARIDAGKVIGGLASFGPLTPSGTQRTLAIQDASVAAACSSSLMLTVRREAMLPDPPTGITTGRVLLAAAGHLGGLAWGVGASFEAGPATGAAQQVVTYANVTMGSISFGSTDHMGVASASPLTTTSYEWPARPADLQMKFDSVTRVFDWLPSASTAIAIGVFDGTSYRALELDTPFGGLWSINVLAPH